jgi:hypothetical protein
VEAIPAPMAALPPPPPAPPAPPPAAAEPISTVPGGEKVLPPLTALLFPAQAPEVGPREARPAILRAPAGPTPQATPGPVSGDRGASIAAGPCQSPASTSFRLARNQSGSPSELGPSAIVAAPDAQGGLACPPPIEPPKAAQGPVPGPAKAGPAPPLTPEQQTLLSHLPEAVQQQVYLWLMSGDVILMREAQRRLTPPRPRPVEPRSTSELLVNIRADPSYPAKAATLLAQEFQDQKSWDGFKARCDAAYLGQISPAQLVAAYHQALGPKARNRGAVFNHCLSHRRE